MTDFPDPELILQETRLRFIAEFRDHCLQIEQLATRGDAGSRDQAIRLLHRMAGLAGTLGFLQSSIHAARFENDLRDGAATPGAVETHMGALRRVFTEELTASMSSAPAPDVRHTPMTVLLVEDDPDQRSIVSAHLRRAGHTVVEIDSGDRAVAAARETAPTLALLDLDLPGMDGHSICRAFKADPALASIPIVFLSAERDLQDRMIGLALGADDFLLKPLDPTELLVRLHRIAGRLRPAEARGAGALLSYEAFRIAADRTLRTEPAAIALIRASGSIRQKVIDVLRNETRHRDIVGEYDRNHLAVLMPNVGAATARDRLAAMIRGVQDDTAAGVAAGIAASPAAAARPVEDLFEEADAALGVARQRQVPAAIRSDDQPGPAKTGDAPVVLVGDDDPDVVRIVDAHLGAAGYRRVLAFDGVKTYEQVQALRPAVLVVDDDAADDGLRRAPEGPRGPGAAAEDHCPLRAGPRGGRDPGVRSRRRRLRGQAVQPAGARGAREPVVAMRVRQPAIMSGLTILS